MSPAMQTDRGWAWVVLAASMGSNFLTGALAYSIGVIHVGLLRKYQESVTMTAWVGGLFMALGSLIGPLTSLIIGRFGCRVCCVLGGVLLFIGFSASAFVTSIGQLYVTYGLIAGLGLDFVCTPTIITVGFYFDKLRPMASGVSMAIIAVGILSGSLIIQALMEEYSVNGAFLLLGAISLHYCFFCMFLRPTVYEGRYKQNTETQMEEEFCVGSVHSLTVHVITQSASNQSLARVDDQVNDEISRVPLLQAVGNDCDDHFTNMKESGQVLTETCGIEERSGNKGDNLEFRSTHNQQECSKTGQRPEDCSASSQFPQECSQNINSTKEYSESVINREECSEQINDRKERLKPVNDDTDECSKNVYNIKECSTHVDDTKECVVENDSTGDYVRSDQKGKELPLSKTDTGVRRKLERYDKPAIFQHVVQPEITVNGNDHTSSVDGMHVNKYSSKEPQVIHDSTSPQDVSKVGQVNHVHRSHAEAYKTLLGNAAFMCYCGSQMAAFIGFAGVFLHLPEYVQTLGTSPVQAAALFVAVGLLSMVSRLASGLATTDQRIDPLTINMGLCGLCGLVTALFPLFSDSYGGQMAYSALFGLYSGGLPALFTSIIVQIVGVSLLNTGFSVVNFSLGVGFISGPPLAALVVDSGGTYEHSFVFLGCMMEVAFFLNLAAGFFLQSPSPAVVDEVAVVDRDLMGSTVPQSADDNDRVR